MGRPLKTDAAKADRLYDGLLMLIGEYSEERPALAQQVSDLYHQLSIEAAARLYDILLNTKGK